MPTNSPYAPPLWIPRSLLALFCAGFFLSHILVQIGAALFFFYTIYLALHRRPVITRAVPGLVLIYLVSGLYAFIVSGQSWSQPKDLLPHLVLFALIPVSLEADRVIRPHRALWLEWMVYGAGLSALAGVVNHFSGMPRTEGFFGGYFTLAALMTFTIPLSIGVFIHHSSARRWLIAFSLLVQITALWWTYTRSAFLGLFLGLGAWGLVEFFRWLRRRRLSLWQKSLGIAFLIALPMALGSVLLQSDNPRVNPFAGRKSAAGEGVSRPDFTSGRKSIVEDALRILDADIREGNWKALLMGRGLSSRKRLVDSPYGSWESDYLQALMNQGVFGLLLVVLIYAVFFRKVISGLLSGQYLTASLAAAGLAFIVMSFLTLQLCGFNSAAIFVFLYANLFSSTHF